MKFTIEKQPLLKALERCKSVTDNKGPYPILSHVLLKTDVDKMLGCVALAATDLFVSIRTEVPASVDDGDEGSITLNAKDLYDRVKQMPDGKVRFNLDGTKVTLKAEGTSRRFVMHGLPADEFPKLPEFTTTNNPLPSFCCDAKDLAHSIDTTIYSVSTDETRQHLNSLLIELQGDTARFVSTDGHRLALLRYGTTEAIGDVTQWLIPLKAAREILKLATECAANKHANQNVIMDRDGANLFVELNDFVFCAKLVDAQFPPYQQVIPNDSKRIVTIDRKQLFESLKAIVVAAGDNKGVKFTFDSNKLVLTTKSAQGGDGSDELECVYDGKEVFYGINAQYVCDALRCISTEKVTLKFGDELDPCVIVPVDSDQYLAVVMPMRLN